jgi:hypothetical protein
MPAKETYINIFPNPSNGIFSVELFESGQLIIYDLLGKEMVNRAVNKGINEIKVDYLKPGIYVIKYKSTSGEIDSKRLLIE